MMGGALGRIDDDMMPGSDDAPAFAVTAEGVAVTPLDDGGIEVDWDYQETNDLVGTPDDPAAQEHGANLALFLDGNTLDRMAEELIEAVEEDDESRAEWKERLAKGIEMIGVAEEKKEGPFPGASRVVHPVLAEACVQFQSRAIAELFPASGPAKCVVLGEANEEKVQQARRVEDFVNYQYTFQMPEAFWEMDQMLMRLPLDGSAFKKVYADPLRGRPASIFVPAERLIVPYGVTSLETAPRYTHVLDIHHNDLLKQQASGFYRDCKLEEPTPASRDRIREEIDDTEGRSPSDSAVITRAMDYIHQVYEVHCDYDIPGFEDRECEGDDGEMKPTGIGLPYIVAIEVQSKRVLSVRRNWKQGDAAKRKRVYFKHYKFLPGLGFYGYGFLHTIGGLARAATGAMRQLLDSGKFASLQGGFKTKDARLPAGSVTITPGQWVDVETTAEDLQKAFFRPPYAEPSGVLFNLLGFVTQAAQRFASTTEAMVGDADNKGPVGTTVALIEQGSKVFSAIHKRCHRAQGEELRLIIEIDYEIMRDNGIASYPYDVAGASRQVMATDFDGRVDVVPVSDPNIFSATQRIAQAQAVWQLAQTDTSGGMDKRQALIRVLEAMRVDDIDTLVPDRSKVLRLDPVSENMAVLMGKPIQAKPEQDHAAHMAVHEQWFGTLPPQGQKMLESVFLAHMAEHLAWQYRAQAAMVLSRMGVNLPPAPDFHAESGVIEGREMPVAMENALSQAAAMAIQQMQQQGQGGDKPPPPDPEMVKAQAEIARKDAIAQADIARRDKAAEADIRRQQALTAAGLQERGARLGADLEERDIRTAADMLRRSQNGAETDGIAGQ